jgi:hypothetical protein
MMMALNFMFAVLICIGIILLQVILMGIARFFERTSGQATRYQLYLASIALTIFSSIRYLLRIPNTGDSWPDFVGDPWANVSMFIAGIMIIVLSNSLYERMMGGERCNEAR